MRSTGRALRAAAAAAAAGVALAACGGGGGAGARAPSALDPAKMVPGTALEYVAVTIKPQGTLRTELTQAIDRVAGPGTTRQLVAQLKDRLASGGGALSGLESWAGQRVGLALVSYPPSLSDLQSLFDEVLIVVPTNDPGAARSFLAKHFNGPGQSGSVVGDYAIFGGQAAVGAALATKSSTSLAADASYRREVSELGPDQLLTVFGRDGALVRRLLPRLRAQARANPVLGMELPMLTRESRSAGDTGLAISAAPDALRLDVVQQRPPAGSSGTAALSALPGDSWLALHLGGVLANRGYRHMLARLVPALIARTRTQVGAPPTGGAGLAFVERDLLPALGPVSLSVAGTSKATARLGVELSPPDAMAGARLVHAIRGLIKGQRVRTGESGGDVLLTYGYRTLQDFLTPSSRLGASPAYRTAVAKLPPGSRPDVYVDFGPINVLMGLDHNPKDATVKRILSRFAYVVAGGTPTHFRLVVAVR